MKKSNPHQDEIIRPFSGDRHAETYVAEESSLPSGSPVEDPDVGTAEPPSASTWAVRLKHRWESMLAWLAKGAEHACPT